MANQTNAAELAHLNQELEHLRHEIAHRDFEIESLRMVLAAGWSGSSTVGTGAGEGAPRQDTGSAWVTRSTDCPEAPAQAHRAGWLSPEQVEERVREAVEAALAPIRKAAATHWITFLKEATYVE